MTIIESRTPAPVMIDGPPAQNTTRPVLMESPLEPDPALYRGLLDELEEGVYFVDRTERIQFWNRGAEAITGFSRDEVVGRTCADNLLCHVDSSGRFLCTNGCPLRRVFLTGVPIETDACLQHKEGHRVPVHIKTKPLLDRRRRVVGAVEVFRGDPGAGRQEKLIQELSQLAIVDDLTRLPNRRHFDAQLERRLAELSRFGWPFGVLMIDIDHFKQINDSFGHQLGDDILRLVARSLSANCRMLDTVARWGGDEFTAIIANVDEEKLQRVAEKLRAMIEASGLRDPVWARLRTTVSVGCALAKPNETAADLVKRADDLLCLAKQAGRNRVCSYSR
jgi:diguanylate cyclase (GGDEF)-like protein/PAS domain S-box-containing protein